ncbi:MAG TPA: MFS transporter [Steroidobacteraceae bacterium]|nr:MFS transporter [Steroidobacteraceae bacterium]
MRTTTLTSTTGAGDVINVTSIERRRSLWSACVAHALHDGYTDLMYVLLPVWQAEFGLGYEALAILRAGYAATMAGLQWPAGRLAERYGGRAVLIVGTVLAALGYAFAGLSGTLFGLCAALALSGGGSSTQHPIASGSVSRAYGKTARGPLGIYNFSGDLGKAMFPAAVSFLLIFMTWRHALWIMSAVGIAVAAGLAFFLPTTRDHSSTHVAANDGTGAGQSGFPILFAIGVLDTAVRMGLLMFLPFLLKAKGASLSVIGLSLSMLFIGGAAGKFICGWLGARAGVIRTVIATESATAACILAVLFSPLAVTLPLLPVLGLMLNGTSSVLYGTVPDLAAPHRTERAFALFYSGVLGSGAIAPILFGAMGDWVGVRDAAIATALTALAVLPLAMALAPHLRTSR